MSEPGATVRLVPGDSLHCGCGRAWDALFREPVYREGGYPTCAHSPLGGLL